MRCELFWDSMQRRILVYWRRFGRTCRSLEDGTDTLSQNVSKKLPFYAALNPKRAQIVNELAYQRNYVAGVKNAFGFIKQNGIPHTGFVQNCGSFLYRIFIVTLVHAALLNSRVFGFMGRKLSSSSSSSSSSMD